MTDLKMSPEEFAKAKDLFILEQLQAYMEPNGEGGMRWIEPCRLRLAEFEDYKENLVQEIDNWWLDTVEPNIVAGIPPDERTKITLKMRLGL